MGELKNVDSRRSLTNSDDFEPLARQRMKRVADD
jgi:hypothetical protein